MALRFVYQTKIYPYGGREALAEAAAAAVVRAAKYTGDHGLGHAYRVDDVTYSVCVDPDAEEYRASTDIEIRAFPILKRTETGFRIRIGGWDHAPETRWISFAWSKRWAGLTPEEALASFAARRKRQAAIYRGRAQKAEELARRAERILERPLEPAA